MCACRSFLAPPPPPPERSRRCTLSTASVFRQRREISFVDALFLFVTVEQMKLQCLTQIKRSLHFNRLRWWVLLLFMRRPPHGECVLLLYRSRSLRMNRCDECLNESNASRPRSFIRLVDYLVASTFHRMVVKAVAHVLTVLQQRLCQTPVQSWSQPDPTDEEVNRHGGQNNGTSPWSVWIFLPFDSMFCFDSSPPSPKPPVSRRCSSRSSFWTQKRWPTTPLRTNSRSAFNFCTLAAGLSLYCTCLTHWRSKQESFSELFGQIKQTVMAVPTLTDDPDFDVITEHTGDKVGDIRFWSTVALWDYNVVCLCVKSLRYTDTEATNLESIMARDEHLQSLIQSVEVCLKRRLSWNADARAHLWTDDLCLPSGVSTFCLSRSKSLLAHPGAFPPLLQRQPGPRSGPAAATGSR